MTSLPPLLLPSNQATVWTLKLAFSHHLLPPVPSDWHHSSSFWFPSQNSKPACSPSLVPAWALTGLNGVNACIISKCDPVAFRSQTRDCPLTLCKISCLENVFRSRASKIRGWQEKAAFKYENVQDFCFAEQFTCCYTYSECTVPCKHIQAFSTFSQTLNYKPFIYIQFNVKAKISLVSGACYCKY